MRENALVDDANKNYGNPLAISLPLTTQYSDHYGTIWIKKEKHTFTLSEIPDSLIADSVVFDIDWDTKGIATFGSQPQVKLDYLKVNNSTFREYQNSGGYQYNNSSFPLYFDATNNLIEWSIGNVPYSTDISMASADINIISPSFMQQIKRTMTLQSLGHPAQTPMIL